METKKRIMVVEDEWVIANDISTSLKGLGYEVCAIADSGNGAIKKAEQMKPDLVLMDIILIGEMDGIQAATEIRRRWNIPVIYLTAHADDRMLQKAKITEPFGYLLKPFENNELRSTIEIALYKHQMERQLRESNEQLDAINNAISLYLGKEETNVVFKGLLYLALSLTKSEYGFIAEYQNDGYETPSLVFLSCYSPFDSDESLNFFEKYRVSGMKFENFHNLLGEVVKTKARVISNTAENDPRKGDLPAGHPPIRSFLGLPLLSGENLVGLLCVANGKEGYEEIIASKLDLALRACAVIIKNYKDDGKRFEFERELVQAKEKAEEATKLKDKFVSLIAHDLRGPLSNLAGFLKLVKDPAIQGEKKEEIIHLADDTAKRLMTLTEELLSVSMLKTGKIKPSPVFMDAFTAVNQVVVNSKPIAEKKGISIANQVPRGLRLYADPMLFGEVLKNLVSNAIKFSRAGGAITIHIPDGKPSTIAVMDTGIGINPGLLKNLFNYETKTSTMGTSGEPGTGLGLPLSMDIMKAHQGNLMVESSVGKGSVFYAELPNVRPRIIVVEDDEGERILIEKMLDPLDVEIFKAENGKEALEIINASKPHLILSDVYMPKMNGFQLLDAVRGSESFKGISYILLTVDTSMEMREKAFQHGADDFLTKPLVKEDLLPRVGKYIMKSSYWGRI